MTIDQLAPEEYPSYFQTYLNLVDETPLLTGLEAGMAITKAYFETLPEIVHEHRYADGKWTPKEILLHLVDSERMFSYRALNFARTEDADLPGYDENRFAKNSRANDRSMSDLIGEYISVRIATLDLFRSFSEDIMLRRGRANGLVCSIRALGFIICGHEKHHRNIIADRYV